MRFVNVIAIIPVIIILTGIFIDLIMMIITCTIARFVEVLARLGFRATRLNSPSLTKVIPGSVSKILG